MPSLPGTTQNLTTSALRPASTHPLYETAVAAVQASRAAKLKGDKLAERRLLRSALKLTDRIIADVHRGRLS